MSRKSLFVLALFMIAALSLSGCVLAGALDSPQEQPAIKTEAIRWLEISPFMSLTTYVDDAASIKGITDLLNNADLHPIPSEQAEQAEPNPSALTVNGNTYPRNIRIEFIWEPSGSAQYSSILFYGDYIKIDDQYYSSDIALTDEFIAILDEIHRLGLAKSAQEIIAE